MEVFDGGELCDGSGVAHGLGEFHGFLLVGCYSVVFHFLSHHPLPGLADYKHTLGGFSFIYFS